MNIIEQVSISGFWGNHSLVLDLNKDVNFLIGVNGSGKTTVINLIASALNADFQTLDRIQFDKIIIQLKEIGGSRKPSIEVEKSKEKRLPFSSILYKIRNKSRETPIEYSLSDLEEQFVIRGESFIRHYPNELFQRNAGGLLEHLRSLVNIKWLSIHRSDATRSIREERGFESTVDKKLSELSNDFVKYFSSLTKLAEVETEKFQKFFFLSLIPTKSELALSFGETNLNLDGEKSALGEIYEKFNVEKSKYTKPLEEYIKDTKEAFEQFNKGDNIKTSQIVNILSAWRIHKIVQNWSDLNDRLKRIYEPKELFLQTINSMLQRKRLFLNDKNELIVETQSGKNFSPNQLSSGEKQLMIILGESLLQKKDSWIYIADEPELSLHVKWQEQLITSLRKINPNTQILFATHSPDIVSIYSKNVFNMEDYLQ